VFACARSFSQHRLRDRVSLSCSRLKDVLGRFRGYNRVEAYRDPLAVTPNDQKVQSPRRARIDFLMRHARCEVDKISMSSVRRCTRKLRARIRGSNVEFLRLVIPSNSIAGPFPAHPKGAIEHVHVASGSVRILLGLESVTLGRGDLALVLPARRIASTTARESASRSCIWLSSRRDRVRSIVPAIMWGVGTQESRYRIRSNGCTEDGCLEVTSTVKGATAISVATSVKREV